MRSPISVILTCVIGYDDGAPIVSTGRVDAVDGKLSIEAVHDLAHLLASNAGMAIQDSEDDVDAVVNELLLDDEDEDSAPKLPHYEPGTY